MKHRSPAAVLLLPIITFGIYALYWVVATKGEINDIVTDKVPTAWLLIVPVANFFFLWKYAAGAAEVTKGGLSQGAAFALALLLGPIGYAIIQSSYNKVAA